MAYRLEDPDYAQRVGRLLDRLEELKPVLVRTQHDKWLGWFRNAMAVVSLIAFVVAGLALTKAHQSDQESAEHTRQLATCINDVLGTRSTVGVPDPLLNHVLNTPQAPRTPHQLVTDTDANRAVYRELNKMQSEVPSEQTRAEFFAVSKAAQRVLDANQEFRATHPLGRC